MQSYSIEMLSPHASTETAEIAHITNIVNQVYASSEGGLWTNDVVRTTVDEVANIIKSGELAVARSDEQITGCIRVRQLDHEIGELGMLAVSPEHQNVGLGRRLIRFAEETCHAKQLSIMQLELLVPQRGSHPSKVILADWYSRLGYTPIRTDAVDNLMPELVPLLAIPCKFIVYQKQLGC